MLIYYLTGDEIPNSYLCSLPGANCRQKFMTVGPAVDSMEQENLAIYKDGVFPRCVLFHSFSGKRNCCNAVYRNPRIRKGTSTTSNSLPTDHPR